MRKGVNYSPNESDRGKVEALAAFGIAQIDIASYMDMDTDTLQKHYPSELRNGRTRLTLICGQYLIECVEDARNSPRDRSKAAMFLLARCCGWIEKTDSTALDAIAIEIRESVNALKDARTPKPVDKDVDTNAGDQAP